MFWRGFSFLATVVVALQLGACITSKYDISNDLKPAFPIKAGSYVNSEGNAILDVRISGDRYRISNRKDKAITYALSNFQNSPNTCSRHMTAKRTPSIMSSRR